MVFYNGVLKKFYINNSNIIYVSKEVKHINNEYIGSGKIIIDTSSIKDKILIIKSNNESIKINNNELENQKYIFINNSDKLEITFSNKFNYNDIECFYMNDNIDIIPEPEPDKQHHPSQSTHGFIILFS